MEQCEPNTRPTFGWKANVQWFILAGSRYVQHASAHQFVSYGSVTPTLRKTEICGDYLTTLSLVTSS